GRPRARHRVGQGADDGRPGGRRVLRSRPGRWQDRGSGSTGGDRTCAATRAGWLMADRSPATHADLVRWSEALAGIARTGLAFTESLYERERFEEVLHIAGDMRAAIRADESLDVEDYVDEWM